MTEEQLTKLTYGICAEPPTKTPDWFKCEDVLSFLAATTQENVPVYVSARGCYLYSVFVPVALLKDNYVNDLMRWNFSASKGWGYWEAGAGRSPRFGIARPLRHTDSTIIDAGEPLVFLREFDGYPPGQKSYCEANQRFLQISNIHWTAERGAFCSLDENGDFAEVLSIKDSDDLLLCAADRDALDLYMLMTEAALVRVFDVIRLLDHDSAFGAGEPRSQLLHSEQSGVHAELRLRFLDNDTPVDASLRGVQILRIEEPSRAWNRLTKRPAQKYATFVISDWKNKLVREWSCDPKGLGNYFLPSEHPFETSPAYFRPDVLLKYKADPSKYTLDYSSISCRGAWHLQTYGVNDAGQVFTYVCYLGHLPYSEQLYWKSFNEEPKAGIPESRITTDFKGEFWLGYDPLLSLKRSLEAFPCVRLADESIAIFTLDSEGLARIHYVFTESPKEWTVQVLELAKVVVDGLSKAAIRKLAKRLACDDPHLGSIKLLLACLRARGVDTEVVDQVGKPLTDLQAARSMFSAHGGGSAPRKQFRAEFRRRLEDVHRAMERLAELLTAGVLNVS